MLLLFSLDISSEVIFFDTSLTHSLDKLLSFDYNYFVKYVNLIECKNYKQIIKWSQSINTKPLIREGLFVKRTALFLLLVFIFFPAPAALAAKGSLGGSWNYTLEGSGTYEGDPVSMRETGNLKLNSDDSHYEHELLLSYSISYNGVAHYGPERHEYNGSHNENFPANTFVPYRDSVEFQYRLSVGGKNVLLKARIAQENENKISGTAQFSEDSGPYIGTITLVAHRNTENGSGGGCNTGASPLFLLALLPIIFKLRK